VILSSIPRSFAIPLEIPTCQRRRHRLDILQELAPGLVKDPLVDYGDWLPLPQKSSGPSRNINAPSPSHKEK
jgi:hypothetical protein